jgi:SSS family solute:Na+ symporter
LIVVDYLVLAAYLGVALGIGFAFRRRGSRSMTDFFLSGRSLPWWLAGVSMVATTFAADTPLQVTEWVRGGGIWQNWFWLTFGVGQVLSAFLFAALWRRMGLTTDLELIERRYAGPPARALRAFKATFFALVYNLIVLGWVLRGMSTVVEVFTGASAEAAILGCVLVALVYSLLAGLTGVVWTDLVQFLLAMGGAVVFAVLAVGHVGGLSALVDRVAAAPGGAEALTVVPGPAHPGFPKFLVFLLVMWWATHNADGGGYLIQRMMSCRDERHAAGAALGFALVHNALRIWPWVLIALVTLVMMPGTVDGGDKAAYPRTLLAILPAGAKGLLVVMFLAAFMSTVDTHLNWGASYVVNDLYRRFVRPTAPPRHYVGVARITMVLVAGLGSVVAFHVRSLTDAYVFVWAMGAGIGPVLILRWFWWRINAWSEITALAASLGLAVAMELDWLGNPFGAAWHGNPHHMALVILPVAGAAWITATFLTRPEPRDRLAAFYRRARPGGAWRPVTAGMEPIADPALSWRVLPRVMSALVLVFGTLLGIGALLLESAASGAFLLGLAALGGVGVAFGLRTRRGSSRTAPRP